MPGMGSVEATRHIRGFTKVPVIALTADAVNGMREMFLENRFNDFLTKPIVTVKQNAMLEHCCGDIGYS